MTVWGRYQKKEESMFIKIICEGKRMNDETMCSHIEVEMNDVNDIDVVENVSSAIKEMSEKYPSIHKLMILKLLTME